jgi:hypothetical protein
MVVRTKGPHSVLPEGYSGVLMLDKNNKSGNEKLRKLEPPKHDMWDPYRGSDAGINGWAIVNELDAWVRESLRTLNQKSDTAVDEIPGLNKMLPELDQERDDLTSYSDDGDESERDDKESANETTVVQDNPLKKSPPRKPISLKPSDVGGEGARIPTSPGKGGGGGGGGTGKDIGGAVRMDTSNLSIRAFPIGDPSKGDYKIIFYSPEMKKGAIKLIGAGDDADYPFEIESAVTDTGKVLEISDSFIKNLEIMPEQSLTVITTSKTKRRFAFSVGVESHVS